MGHCHTYLYNRTACPGLGQRLVLSWHGSGGCGCEEGWGEDGAGACRQVFRQFPCRPILLERFHLFIFTIDKFRLRWRKDFSRLGRRLEMTIYGAGRSTLKGAAPKGRSWVCSTGQKVGVRMKARAGPIGTLSKFVRNYIMRMKLE